MDDSSCESSTEGHWGSDLLAKQAAGLCVLLKPSQSILNTLASLAPAYRLPPAPLSDTVGQ